MSGDRTIVAIETSDTDELVRIVDGHAAARAWGAMAEVRRRCDEALERGKQLWGASEYIRYRFALDAPAEWAGPAVTEGRTRFTLGPLSEVAASTKTWDELEPHLAPGPERAMVAHERVVRGEILTDAAVDRTVLELPLELQPWEPAYPLVTYRTDRVEVTTPPSSRTRVSSLPEPGAVVDDPEGTRALLALVEHWVDTSNGRSQAVCAEGSASQAVAALGLHSAGVGQTDGATALAWMAWAASTGGAHGRRRGAAIGRFTAWWAAHEIAGLDWPPEPAEFGEAIGELRWFLWTDGTPDLGWSLSLAVESSAEGVAWALMALDAD
ncbi:hypothetical protein BH23ACT5_BH23ACT5_20280 [soil metagenome]